MTQTADILMTLFPLPNTYSHDFEFVFKRVNNHFRQSVSSPESKKKKNDRPNGKFPGVENIYYASV